MQPIVKAIGWSILNSLWQSACIYFVLFIVMLSFPKLLAKYRHNISFVSIGLMFSWFVYTFFSKIEWGIAKGI